MQPFHQQAALIFFFQTGGVPIDTLLTTSITSLHRRPFPQLPHLLHPLSLYLLPLFRLLLDFPNFILQMFPLLH